MKVIGLVLGGIALAALAPWLGDRPAIIAALFLALILFLAGIVRAVLRTPNYIAPSDSYEPKPVPEVVEPGVLEGRVLDSPQLPRAPR